MSSKPINTPNKLSKLRSESARLRDEIAELRKQHIAHLAEARNTANEAMVKTARVERIERDIATLQYGIVAMEAP